jgi:hypothetical protein
MPVSNAIFAATGKRLNSPPWDFKALIGLAEGPKQDRHRVAAMAVLNSSVEEGVSPSSSAGPRHRRARPHSRAAHAEACRA